MKRITYGPALVMMFFGSAHADTIISLKPELSINSDGKALVVNAVQYCAGATSLFVDTTTTAGKTMYSLLVAANVADKTIHVQTGCTCSANCSGAVQVFRVCTVVSESQQCQ